MSNSVSGFYRNMFTLITSTNLVIYNYWSSDYSKISDVLKKRGGEASSFMLFLYFAFILQLFAFIVSSSSYFIFSLKLCFILIQKYLVYVLFT